MMTLALIEMSADAHAHFNHQTFHSAAKPQSGAAVLLSTIRISGSRHMAAIELLGLAYHLAHYFLVESLRAGNVEHELGAKGLGRGQNALRLQFQRFFYAAHPSQRRVAVGLRRF